jgi:uncharacterized protein YxjI
MKYVIACTGRVLGQRYEITDDSGAPLFKARSSYGAFGTKLTATDSSGREIMSVRMRLNSSVRDVYAGDEHVARLWRQGGITRHPAWIIEADAGGISGEGLFGEGFKGGEYKLSKDGTQVATTVRLSRLKWSVDIDDYEDQVTYLAIILGIAHNFLSPNRG